jgi:hypothetical protein
LSDNEVLKELLHRAGLTNSDRAVIILASEAAPLKQDSLAKIATDCGLGRGFTANVARTLATAKQSGLVIKTPKGWEPHSRARPYLESLGIEFRVTTATKAVLPELRRAIQPIASEPAGMFALEAIECIENGQLRAGVVFAWIGAVALLYEHVITNRRADFNTAGKARFAGFTDAVNVGDLTRLKEADFLQILQDISVIDKTLKKQLTNRLDLRNACGHPNAVSAKLGELEAAAHVEFLVAHIYAVF